MKTPLLDSWTIYGPGPNKDPDERWTLEHLLADMDFCGIAGALVRHRQMNVYDAMHVNNRLIRELQPHRDRLFPAWAVQPHQAGDFPEPCELRKRMAHENVRAVFMQPGLQRYPIHEDVLGPLAETLNQDRILILTTLPELGNSYAEAVRFCRLFDQCPVLIGEATWSQWRMVVAIMDACPNALIEFHFFQANRAVEFFAERYGVERLLFGSGLLKHSAGAARGFIDWPLLSDDQIERFAGENLQGLLGVDRVPAIPVPDTEDRYMRAAREQQPVPGVVLDAHCHVLDDGLHGAGSSYVMRQGDAAHMLELTRLMGVKKTAMMSWNGTVGMDVEAGNTLIDKIVDKYPDEVIGLSSCDPTHQTPRQIEDMCRYLHLNKGFCGMKPYHRNATSYADSSYDPYWSFGNNHRLYALLHVDSAVGGIEAVRILAARYPDLTILIAHSGGSWSFARQVAGVVGEFPNVMAELTLTPVTNGVIEWLCRKVGADRILFGTDAPMRDPRPQLGWCVYTRLDQEDKARVLGGNFARVLDRRRL